MATAQPTPLEQIIVKALESTGFNKLSAEDRAGFLPELVVQLQTRIGIALERRLDEKLAAEFAKLMERGESSSAVWQDFFAQIPDFEDVVQEEAISLALQFRAEKKRA